MKLKSLTRTLIAAGIAAASGGIQNAPLTLDSTGLSRLYCRQRRCEVIAARARHVGVNLYQNFTLALT